jgi:hypothetical protein
MSLVWSRRFIISAQIETGFPPFKPKPHTTELGPLPNHPSTPILTALQRHLWFLSATHHNKPNQPPGNHPKYHLITIWRLGWFNR